MTISFHHAFRGGDLTINLVMDAIARMGFKNLTLASSSLSDCHAPLVEHIRQGVVSRIYTSGLRGPLAEGSPVACWPSLCRSTPMAAVYTWCKVANSALMWHSSAYRPVTSLVTLTAIPVKRAVVHWAMPASMPKMQNRLSC